MAGTIPQEIQRINAEVAAQAAKIATVSDVLTEKGSTSNAVGETAATPIAQNTTDLDALIAKANALPDAGTGGGGGAVVEYEIITIPVGATSATYTLPRVTGAYGGVCSSLLALNSNKDYDMITTIINRRLMGVYYIDAGYGRASIEFDTAPINYNNGTITLEDYSVIDPITLCLINDPNAEAIST